LIAFFLVGLFNVILKIPFSDETFKVSYFPVGSDELASAGVSDPAKPSISAM
jgi:hypothetical protein